MRAQDEHVIALGIDRAQRYRCADLAAGNTAIVRDVPKTVHRRDDAIGGARMAKQEVEV